MSDDYNKGYFSHGSGSGSHEFQQGVWARQAEERRAREAAERQARERDEAFAREMSERSREVNPGFSMGRVDTWSGPSGAGASSSGEYARNGALIGAMLCLLYAVFYTADSDASWIVYPLAGAAVGALAGVALYVTFILLRWAVILLAYALGLGVLAAIVVAIWQSF
ncbi:hypothetical protein F8A86_07085 [Betaproteobacteria bacterium SCN1]|jgi:hypothetical protein|nr:hypothetical protein F8A86_07085 [Betaproteobacteria bacterium SCN1]MBN8759999.1 hypothetical protein [Thiobacillus sp.]ODU90870.1 MAG: hypothetical protein ABT21_02280 [Thiobacillus sp. SCN 65-179]OJW35705.1 MAG: hypothetical protein BGO61_06920 [Thiobacillus sp. 65-69]